MALWRVWAFSWSASASYLSAYCVDRVEAPTAFLAIVGLMRLHRLDYVPQAAAVAKGGGSLRSYRAYRVRLAPVADGEVGWAVRRKAVKHPCEPEAWG